MSKSVLNRWLHLVVGRNVTIHDPPIFSTSSCTLTSFASSSAFRQLCSFRTRNLRYEKTTGGLWPYTHTPASSRYHGSHGSSDAFPSAGCPTSSPILQPRCESTCLMLDKPLIARSQIPMGLTWEHVSGIRSNALDSNWSIKMANLGDTFLLPRW